MQRHLAGVIALVLLLTSAVLLIVQPAWDPSLMFAASSLRIGAVVGAIWLAYPELKRLPRWLVPVLVGSAVAVAVRPKLALFLVPLVVAIMILRPKKKKLPVARQTGARK